MSSQGRENRKVKRVALDRALKVIISSIGAQVRYEVSSRDISHNGFFLDFENPNRFPFNQSSILEVWAELETGRTVFFNGKMARVVAKDNAVVNEIGAGIAIKIVLIDKENEKILADFIARKLADGTAIEDVA